MRDSDQASVSVATEVTENTEKRETSSDEMNWLKPGYSESRLSLRPRWRNDFYLRVRLRVVFLAGRLPGVRLLRAATFFAGRRAF